MTDESLVLLVEDLLEFLNSMEAAITLFKGQIDKNFGQKREKTWDPNKIKWDQADGKNGPYERSEDVNNSEFKTMLKDLTRHGGKLTRNGWFYWTFKNGLAVGRKKRG
jgi:hypothetical protein